MENKLIITPKTKIAELLNAYPDLEDVLIELAPAFKKLKNPVLRRTIARITSLEQAAAVGEIPIGVIVNKLRAQVGQADLDSTPEGYEYYEVEPSWFSTEHIVNRYDARADISNGEHPLSKVFEDLSALKEGDIYELTTPFLPAPLIDKVRGKGFEAWSKENNPGIILNYFTKLKFR